MANKGYLFAMLVGLLAPLSCIGSEFGQELLLQHSASLLLIFFFVWAAKKGFNTFTLFLVFLFAVLHCLGARYTYSYTPYNQWLISAFSWDMDAYFGLERNHFDRLVHLSFGFLFLPCFAAWAQLKQGLKGAAALWQGFLLVQFGSLVYELFEWGLTMALSPEQADSYNGQQGDAWDAQKDMALAMLGSILSWVVFRNKDFLKKGA